MSETPAGSQDHSQSVTGQEPLDPPVDSPVVFAHVVAEAIRELIEESHLHEWDILGVYTPPSRPVIHPLMAGSVPTTFVLIRCGYCNLPQSIELEGDWTEEQVMKKVIRNEEQ